MIDATVFQIFDKLRDEKPEVLDKVKPINGNICLPNLGMDDQQKKSIVGKTNVVFHSAATIK